MQLHLLHQGSLRRLRRLRGLRGRGVAAQVMRRVALLPSAKQAVQQLLGAYFLSASPPSLRHALKKRRRRRSMSAAQLCTLKCRKLCSTCCLLETSAPLEQSV